MIELDVQLSYDQRLVVIHDHELERTTTGRGRVSAHRLAELKSLDAGAWFGPQFAGERLLTLEEVMTLVGSRARLNIELKPAAEDREPLAGALARVLATSALKDSVLVSCFDPLALQVLRRQDTTVRLGLLWHHSEFSQAWDLALQIGAVSIHPHWALVSAELVQTAHAKGLDLLTWTVNDVERMRALLRLGVDGIISDFPERFADVGI